MNKEMRKKDIKNLLKKYREGVKFYQDLIRKLKTEQDFINGHYNKSWEEEYGHDAVYTEGGKNE